MILAISRTRGSFWFIGLGGRKLGSVLRIAKIVDLSEKKIFDQVVTLIVQLFLVSEENTSTIAFHSGVRMNTSEIDGYEVPDHTVEMNVSMIGYFLLLLAMSFGARHFEMLYGDYENFSQ